MYLEDYTIPKGKKRAAVLDEREIFHGGPDHPSFFAFDRDG
jgi:hypothetical protein